MNKYLVNKRVLPVVAERCLSQYGLGVWKGPERFLQNPAPILDKISGPMGVHILSSIALGFGTLTGKAHVLSIPALDTN